MNIFWRELHRRWKGVLIWGVAITVFMVIAMVKYGSFSTDPAAVSALMNQLPDTLKAVFGMSGLDVVTITGYYGVNFIFLALMLAIHAGLLGADMLAGEEQGKTAEFLYPKPVSRLRIVTQKLAAAVVIVIVVGVMTAMASYFAMRAYTPFSSFATAFWLFTAALGIIQIVSLFVGTTAAALCHNPKTAPVRVAQFVMVSYFIFIFIKLIPALSWAKYLSIFALFDAKDILDNLDLSLPHVALCLVATAICVTVTYLVYNRRDL